MFHCQEELFPKAPSPRDCGAHELSTADTIRDMKTTFSWRDVFGYSVRFFWLILAAMLVVSAAGVALLAWRNLSRVERIEHTLELTGEIRRLGITIQKQLLEHSGDLVNTDPAILEGISEEIARTEALGPDLQPQTKEDTPGGGQGKLRAESSFPGSDPGPGDLKNPEVFGRGL